ncbi:hypothetical protein [Chitinilyticum piscinae]|uniref:Uncharacterized protein n=1 Tax=Chitinilyticum piscinae TaxID=2866724 RepID=A0A8J7K1P7_9NEIS|nr:hypothetical protein [Chitinilyticum piscinae]MBE9609521.1 hypothetical protein [Chitinilyticum piscinae]
MSPLMLGRAKRKLLTVHSQENLPNRHSQRILHWRCDPAPDTRTGDHYEQTFSSHRPQHRAALHTALRERLACHAGAGRQYSTGTISYSSGKTIVKTGPQGDQVTLLDAQGQLAGESVCDAGSFAAYLSLFTVLRDAARQSKQDALAATIAYPLRVNGGKVRSVRDDAALRKNFAQVFTGPVIAAIGKAEPAAVFCRNGQAMFGDGVGWAELRGKQARVVVINTGL